MANYINPPTRATEGEKLSGRGFAGNYADYVSNARGRALVAYYDRGIFKVAQVIETEVDFKDVYLAYKAGYLLSLDFYALTKAQLEDTE